MDNKILFIAEAIINRNFELLEEWLTEDLNIEMPEDNNLLFHYSSIDTCCKIINSDNLLLFDSVFCNDKQEYKNGLQFVENYLINDYFDKPELFNKYDFTSGDGDFYLRTQYNEKLVVELYRLLGIEYSHINRKWLAYITCFSKARYPEIKDLRESLLPNDNLSMWRGYAKEGQGACIGFFDLELAQLIRKSPGLMMHEVIYKDYQKEFFLKSLFRLIYDMYFYDDNDHEGGSDFGIEFDLEDNDEDLTKEEILKAGSLAFSFIPSFFKHEGFEDENEIRIIYIPSIYKTIDKRIEFMGKGHNARPYLPLSTLIKSRKKYKLPIMNISFGPDVSDQSYHQHFLMTGCKELCKKRKIAEWFSKIPYRSTL